MKFPIGTRFTHTFMNYFVVGYDSRLKAPYIVKFWDDDEYDFDIIEMTEWELEVSIK